MKLYIILCIFLVGLNISAGRSAANDLPDGANYQFKHGDAVYSVAFSPDGKLLASGGANKIVMLWDVATQRELKVFTGPSESVMSVSFSPDGQLLASASRDGYVRLWEVSTKNRRAALHHNGWVEAVAFSPDGKTLASGGEDSNGSVVLWDISQKRSLTNFPGHSKTVQSVAFSPDGQILASTSRDRTANLWNVNGHQIGRIRIRHNDVVHAVVFSPDGDTLATTSRDKFIKLWNVSSGENYHTFKIEGANYVYAEALAFSPDGKFLASGCRDNTIKLWNVESLSSTPTLIRGHDRSVHSVAFSPDGRTLASGSKDGTVLLWNLSHFNIVPPGPIPTPNPVPLPDTISKPKPVIVDTTPPNIIILSSVGGVVPPDTEYFPVRGEVTDVNSINEVRVNGQEVKVSTEGKFQESVELLSEINEIRVSATDLQGNINTKLIIINRPILPDILPPKIEIRYPTELSVPPNTEQLTIEGTVTDDNSISEIKVRDQKVPILVDGEFSATIPLTYGENEIMIAATDRQGNIGANRFTILRPDPIGPEIRILQPEYSRTRGLKPIFPIDADSTIVAGEVEDDNGVSEVRLNDTIVEVRGKYFETIVQLTPGDNFIIVTAKDRFNNISKMEIIIERTIHKREGMDHALLFAVDDYTHWPNLRNPISDAEKIKTDLESIYNFQTTLIKNPTRGDIFEAIRKYGEMDYPDDGQLFIFFAGHGYFDETFSAGYLVAQDTKLPKDDKNMLTYVSHSRIRDDIDAITDCQHILLVLDTCFSGTFDRFIAMGGTPIDLSESLPSSDIERKFEYTTRRYLTSGGLEDVPDVSAFIQTLHNALDSRGGSDKVLTFNEILGYMNNLSKPKPCADGFGTDEEEGDFLFFAIE